MLEINLQLESPEEKVLEVSSSPGLLEVAHDDQPKECSLHHDLIGLQVKNGHHPNRLGELLRKTNLLLTEKFFEQPVLSFGCKDSKPGLQGKALLEFLVLCLLQEVVRRLQDFSQER